VALCALLLASTACGPSVTYEWNFRVVIQYLPILATGLQLSVTITVAGIALGMSWGVLVALMRLSSFPPLQVAITIYIELMRGTPLLVQLVWVYFALPIVTGIQLPAVQAAIVALTLNSGAFFGEAFRSGIQAIPKEQVETAEVLGLTYPQRMRFLIVPQAFRIVLPVLISNSIGLFKDTSLVSTLGVADLMYQGNLASFDSYRPLEILSTVAAFYFAIAFPFTLATRRLEGYLARHRA
jgi:polar amino acid transport system permease protein